MRKISAHYIFPVTSDPVKYGVLTVDDDGTILDISQLNENLPETASVEFYNGVIIPGFVNAHCHLELSHMKGVLSQKQGMATFCEGIMTNRNNLTPANQQISIQKADEQMYLEGVVAVGDIANGESSFKVKHNSLIFYHTFIECLGLDKKQADSIIQQALSVEKAAKQLGLESSITPHAPYSMSENLFAQSVHKACNGGILSIHNQESADEMQLFAVGTSALRIAFEKQGLNYEDSIVEYKNPINRILKHIGFKSVLNNMQLSLLLIHNVYTTPEDVERTINVNPNTSWVLCPNSNLFIEDKLPPAQMFYNKKVNVAIGTDSLSSNTNLSVLDELKTLNYNFKNIPINELFKWATLGGAKALKKDNIFGSFEIGKRPGLTLIDAFDFNNMMLYPESKSVKLL